MVNCVCCGMPVPDGQRVCSMCYGDIDYGRDGYYRQWAEKEEKRMDEKRKFDKMIEEFWCENDS